MIRAPILMWPSPCPCAITGPGHPSLGSSCPGRRCQLEPLVLYCPSPCQDSSCRHHGPLPGDPDLTGRARGTKRGKEEFPRELKLPALMEHLIYNRSWQMTAPIPCLDSPQAKDTFSKGWRVGWGWGEGWIHRRMIPGDM